MLLAGVELVSKDDRTLRVAILNLNSTRHLVREGNGLLAGCWVDALRAARKADDSNSATMTNHLKRL